MKNARIKSIKQSRDNKVQVLKAETMAAIKVTNKSTRQKMRYEDLAKTRLDKLKQANKLIVNLKANIHDDGVSLDELREEREETRQWIPKRVEKVWIKNNDGKGRTQVWDDWVVLMVLEMLSHWTPPSCISANILTVAESLHPSVKATVVSALPSLPFIRGCQSILVVVTKAIAAYQLARADSYHQLFSDGTSRRQTAIQNVVISVLTGMGFKMIALSSGIQAEDETAVATTASIVVTFQDCSRILHGWRRVAKQMYPENTNILQQIPHSNELTLAKLGKGGTVSTDNCNSARKFRRLLMEKIKKIALERGMSQEEIRLFEGDCWQHIRNVWIGAISNELCNYLAKYLEDDLADMPSIYRVNTDAVNLYQALEKDFGEGANYPKGEARLFFAYHNTYNPGAHLWPLSRALGGTRQDIATEGSMAALMNLPYYLDYVNWKLSCGTSDNILTKNLFITLQSVEIIAQLRVLSIFHVAITIPHRWLAGKCGDLDQYDFGLYDMGWCADLLESAFMEIVNNPSLYLNEDFVMGIFSPIATKVTPLADYLKFMFEEKQTFALGSRKQDDLWLPYDELIAELFYPSRQYVRQTTDMTIKLASTVAVTLLAELRDSRKATSCSLSSLDGVRSCSKISEEDRVATLKTQASTSISESVHASSTVGLKMWGTIHLDSVTAEGQTRANNDFGRDHRFIISKKKSNNSEKICRLGTFHLMPIELQSSLIQFGKEYSSAMKGQFDNALKRQEDAQRRKEEIALERKIDQAQSEYIIAIYFYEQYHSKQCWATVEEATNIYQQLPTESSRLNAVKEQILIRYLGLGWKEAHHPWSSQGEMYTSSDIFRHLIETVIPLQDIMEVPDDAPINLPTAPDVNKLGLQTDVALNLKVANSKKIAKFKQDAREERDQREAAGEGDCWHEMQQTIAPSIDKHLIGFRIEMLFTYTNTDDGTTCLNWCHGTVISIMSEKNRAVKIEWDKECLNDNDDPTSNHKLLLSKWNPKSGKPGAWREYLTH